MTASNSHRAKLLLVDDDDDSVIVMKTKLQNLGYYVDAFTEPKQALKQFKPGFYDRIITDIRMPAMSGFDFARQIWELDGNARVCFMSSFEIHESEAMKTMPSLRSHCFIKKPVTPSMLARHVEMHALVY